MSTTKNSDKDWSGNKRSTFVTLGASSHALAPRQERDYYATDPIAVDALLWDGEPEMSKRLWECAAGEGHMANRLKEYGYNVYTSDINDYGCNDDVLDFLSCNTSWPGDIITNPPYKFASDFLAHALELVGTGQKVFMFLKLQFLEGQARKSLLQNSGLKVVYVSSSRIICAKNGDFDSVKGSAVAYAWYEFEKGYVGAPVIKWIN